MNITDGYLLKYGKTVMIVFSITASLVYFLNTFNSDLTIKILAYLTSIQSENTEISMILSLKIYLQLCALCKNSNTGNKLGYFLQYLRVRLFRKNLIS